MVKHAWQVRRKCRYQHRRSLHVARKHKNARYAGTSHFSILDWQTGHASIACVCACICVHPGSHMRRKCKRECKCEKMDNYLVHSLRLHVRLRSGCPPHTCCFFRLHLHNLRLHRQASKREVISSNIVVRKKKQSISNLP